MSNTATTGYPDPRKIENIESHIVTFFEKISEAYERRMEYRQRYWRGLPVSASAVPTLEHIAGMEKHLDDCIRESKRREI